MKRVLLVDNHHVVRKGIRLLLEKEKDIEVIAEAENGKKALEMVEAFFPDLVIIEIGLPIMNGIEATKQIKKKFPEVNILVLSRYKTNELICRSLKAGANGYIAKCTTPDELISAIGEVNSKSIVLSSSISREVIEKFLNRVKNSVEFDCSDILTKRERQILQLIAEGNSNREIAEGLNISIKTVDSHRTHLMEKLMIHNVAELTQYAIQKGIVFLEENFT